MDRPAHPTLEFRHLLPVHGSRRLASLPQASELQFFFNARSALYHVLRHARRTGRSRVLLPAYHCVSVVEPALSAGLRVGFYRIDRELQIDLDELSSLADGEVAAVVFVNLFGFPARLEPLLAELRARGITVIEDCSHSFLLGNPFALSGGRADVSVYSFWKLVPSGIGGAARGARWAETPPLVSSSRRDSLVRSKRLIEQAMVAGGEASLLARLYSCAENARLRWRGARARAAPVAAAASAAPAPDPGLEFDERLAWTRLPWLPSHILRCADLQAVIDARRANYGAYARSLACEPGLSSLLPELAERVCPWAYPVLVPQRTGHDQALRARGVPVWTFGDVLHPALEGAASERAIADARFLAANVLCLPVHQGIPEHEAQRFADIVNDYFASGAGHAH